MKMRSPKHGQGSVRKPNSRRGLATNKHGVALKAFKHQRVGRERCALRNAIANGSFDEIDTELIPWNEWDSPRDGKFYVQHGSNPEKSRRK